MEYHGTGWVQTHPPAVMRVQSCLLNHHLCDRLCASRAITHGVVCPNCPRYSSYSNLLLEAPRCFKLLMSSTTSLFRRIYLTPRSKLAMIYAASPFEHLCKVGSRGRATSTYCHFLRITSSMLYSSLPLTNCAGTILAELSRKPQSDYSSNED